MISTSAAVASGGTIRDGDGGGTVRDDGGTVRDG